jgi:hypothetical protein
MKVQSQNAIYRKITSKCFICSKARFASIPLTSLMFLQCRDYENKCPISNLYNDKIFKL